MPAANVIKLRRGTAAQWTSANPVLADGEPGWETDTDKLKVGDGTTAWDDLDYFVGAAPANMVTTDTAQTITGVKTLSAPGQNTVLDVSSTTAASAGTPVQPGPLLRLGATYWNGASSQQAYAEIEGRHSGSGGSNGAFVQVRGSGLGVYAFDAGRPALEVQGASATQDVAQFVGSAGTAKVTKDGYIVEGVNRVYSAGNPPPAPSNMVTTDTDQTVSGLKTFLTGNGLDPLTLRTSTNPGIGAATNSNSIAFYPKYNVGGTITEVRANLRAAVDPDGSNPRVMTGTGVLLYEAGNRVYSAGNLPPAPSNMVTTDTTQTITGVKTFNGTSQGQVVLRAPIATSGSQAVDSPGIQFGTSRWNGTQSQEESIAVFASRSGSAVVGAHFLNVGAAMKVVGLATTGNGQNDAVLDVLSQNTTNTTALQLTRNTTGTGAYIRGVTSSNTGVPVWSVNSAGALLTTSTVTGDGVYDGTSAIAANRVYSANNTVPVAGLSATGTKDATTFLRGDNTFAVPDAPANMVTTNSVQTLTASKSLSLTAGSTGLTLLPSVNADAANVLRTSPGLMFQAKRWDGSASVTEFGSISGTYDAATSRFFLTAGMAVHSSSGFYDSYSSRLYSNNNKVPASGMSATGTRDATTFLRGDNTFAVPTAAAPSNMVTTDTPQTITGTKEFSAGVYDGSNRVYSAANPPPAATVTSVTSAHTAVAGTVVLANGTFAVTLPAVASGAQVIVKNTGTGVITVTRGGASTIDGATTFVLDIQYASVTVVSDGAQWYVV